MIGSATPEETRQAHRTKLHTRWHLDKWPEIPAHSHPGAAATLAFTNGGMFGYSVRDKIGCCRGFEKVRTESTNAVGGLTTDAAVLLSTIK